MLPCNYSNEPYSAAMEYAYPADSNNQPFYFANLKNVYKDQHKLK